MPQPGVNEVQRAILKGDLKEIDALLKEGIRIQYTTEVEDWNLLHLALQSLVAEPKMDVVRHLIGLGVDVNAQDVFGMTPLHYAVRTTALEAAQLLLEAGAELDTVNRDGFTPLRMADHGSSRSFEMMELLLKHGADPDFRTEKVISARQYAQAIRSPMKDQMLELFERYAKP